MRIVACIIHGGTSRKMTTIRDCSYKDERTCQWRLCEATPVDDYPFAVSSDMQSYFPKCSDDPNCEQAGKWGATGVMPEGHTWVHTFRGGFLAHVRPELQEWLVGKESVDASHQDQ